MDTKQLRKKLKKIKKWPGVKFYKNAPVIHRGFPNCFNLSYGEYEILNKFNQYLDFDEDFIYSKIQPCIRHQDWPTIFKNEKNANHYLSIFDMADISGMIILKDNKQQKETAEFAIKSFIDFIESIGLDKSKLKVSYFKKETVKKATDGKYIFNKTIPTDPMLSFWKELDLRDEQLTPDQTRDTLLSLRIFGLPTAWGYRNEIHYEHKGKLLDIGTVEHMKFSPIFDKGENISGLEEYKNTVAISAIGFERILMVVNNLNNIWEIDTIKPLYEYILKIAENRNEQQVVIAAQALRAIHRIVADGGEYSKLNKRRKDYLREFYRPFFLSLDKLNININGEFLKKTLSLNAKLQKHYPELKKFVKKTSEEVLTRSQNIKT